MGVVVTRTGLLHLILCCDEGGVVAKGGVVTRVVVVTRGVVVT